MDWITDEIAIGNHLEAQNRHLLEQGGIRSVLGLVRTLKGQEPAELGLARIEIVPLNLAGLLLGGSAKDLGLYRRAVQTLAELVQDAPPVLVHCQIGRSRSPVVVAGYLMKSLRIRPEEALLMVAARREIDVVPELIRLLDSLS
jgi:protein-tyrosine phosphatase